MGRFQVQVFGLKGEKKMIDLCDTEEEMKKMTVKQLKEKIEEQWPQGVGYFNSGTIRLYFTDIKLEGDSTLLSSYGIQNKSVIQVVAFLPGGGDISKTEEGGMGDKDGKNKSMEKLAYL